VGYLIFEISVRCEIAKISAFNLEKSLEQPISGTLPVHGRRGEIAKRRHACCVCRI